MGWLIHLEVKHQGCSSPAEQTIPFSCPCAWPLRHFDMNKCGPKEAPSPTAYDGVRWNHLHFTGLCHSIGY